MTTLKAQLESDLRDAMKARDELLTSTLRMAIAAVRTAEVAGKQARELSDDEVISVLTKEAKKRREAADAFGQAGRTEQAAAEQAEGRVLEDYLPAQLTGDELAELVTATIAEVGATEPREMGQVMKVLKPQVAGRADGGRVAAEVKRRLAP